MKLSKKTGSRVSGGLACVEAIELLYEPALPPHVIHNILCMIPHNNPFHISHDTPSPSTARCGFGVFGLIIHFLTASSNPSPDTSWEHSRHNSLKQLYGGKYAFWSDADLTT